MLQQDVEVKREILEIIQSFDDLEVDDLPWDIEEMKEHYSRYHITPQVVQRIIEYLSEL